MTNKYELMGMAMSKAHLANLSATDIQVLMAAASVQTDSISEEGQYGFTVEQVHRKIGGRHDDVYQTIDRLRMRLKLIMVDGKFAEVSQRFKLTDAGWRMAKELTKPIDALQKENDQLETILTAFRIRIDRAKEMFEGQDLLWLKRAGNLAHAILHNFKRDTSVDVMQGSKDPTVKIWLQELPGYYGEGEDNSFASNHQDQIYQRFLRKLISENEHD